MVYSIAANQDSRFFEIDRTSGHVIIKRSIPDDELLQPSTLVVKVIHIILLFLIFFNP